MEKETAALIILRTTRSYCSKAERIKSGVKPHHLNKYPPGHVCGVILTKYRYKLKTLQDNLSKLTAPDAKVVQDYMKDSKKRKYHAHYAERIHWLNDKETIKTDNKAQNRNYLDKNHPLVKELREKIYNISNKYEQQYNIIYLIEAISWRYILLLQAEVKWFEFRSAYKGTKLKNERHFIKTVDGARATEHVKQSKRSTKKKYKNVYEIMDYVHSMNTKIHSFIAEKAEANPNYNPLIDPEVSFYINHLKQWKVEKFQILSAKPLKLTVKQFDNRYFKNTLHKKSWDQLKEEYNPGTAAATS